MERSARRLSVISLLHYVKLIYRSCLLAAALVLYIVHRVYRSDEPFGRVGEEPLVMIAILVIFVVEMLFRFFPSHLESVGCQKQFACTFLPTGTARPSHTTRRSTLAVAVAWLLLNASIGALYVTGVIDEGILILVSLLYSVCDMICILFFCPFQTWFMKNKCCGSCRIYNWDYAMMFTPLVFMPSIPSYTLLGMALLLLLYWEIMVHAHPERFSEETNARLSCANCPEKLCHHKAQLRHFLRKNRERFYVKGNAILERAKRTVADITDRIDRDRSPSKKENGKSPSHSPSHSTSEPLGGSVEETDAECK
ncbi:MAG: hypothetical protein IJW83_02730 [Clostridia bacterium]|nr:hypothetical protein [Clostridia bacterium]